MTRLTQTGPAFAKPKRPAIKKAKVAPAPVALSKAQLKKYEKLCTQLAQWIEEDAKLTEDTWPRLEQQIRANGMSYRTREND